MRALLAVVVVWMTIAGAAAAQTPSSQPSVALPPELERVLRDYEQAWSGRDASALARLFAEDGYVLPNGGEPVKGRDAIERHYQGSGGPLVLRAIAWASAGDIAYVIGGFAREQGQRDIGKFTLTLRRGERGRWLIVSDMDSPNQRSRQP